MTGSFDTLSFERHDGRNGVLLEDGRGRQQVSNARSKAMLFPMPNRRIV
jgi:hypothetical protein